MTIAPNEVSDRPVPVPDADSAPFWEACRDRRLVVQECTSCGQRRYPPVGMCHRCRSWELRWVELGDGEVYSWVVVHHSPIEALRREVPYVVAVIDFGDGVRIPTQLVGVEPDQIHAGMRVRIRWQEIASGDVLALFEPVAPVGSLADDGPSQNGERPSQTA